MQLTEASPHPFPLPVGEGKEARVHRGERQRKSLGLQEKPSVCDR